MIIIISTTVVQNKNTTKVTYKLKHIDNLLFTTDVSTKYFTGDALFHYRFRLGHKLSRKYFVIIFPIPLFMMILSSVKSGLMF